MLQFAFVSFPVPVREDVESFHVLVPVTAVEVIAVFGQSGKVDDTEQGLSKWSLTTKTASPLPKRKCIPQENRIISN